MNRHDRLNRRQALAVGAVGLASIGAVSALAAEDAKPKFTMDLCPGRIGVNTNQVETIGLAAGYGFTSVQPFGSLAGKSNAEREAILVMLKLEDLVWGAGDLPVEFRKEKERFDEDLKNLPRTAAAFQKAGVTRVGTYLLPMHDERTYRQNFELHATRLKAVAKVLGEHGLKFGLEYVGPKTMRTSRRYTFIHTLAETRELVEAIGEKNVGVVLDTWHWYTAEESPDDLRSLKAEDIVAVDLNDAPAGVAVHEQIDNRRELPAATGVIDTKTFMNILVELGYDGPIRAEPFNQPLNEMGNDPAVEATAKALKKAFAMVG